MTARLEGGQLVQHSPVRKPEDLARIVSSKNDKELYIALKHIDFSYDDLFKYLVREFYSDSIQIAKSKSALLSELMEISESTFFRWKNNKKKVEGKYAERLSELVNLFTSGEEVFEAKELFLEWLNTPNLHLEMKLPLSHLDNIPGIRYINHLLDKIEYGAPV